MTVDTLRSDALGCFGGSTPTPTIDALAARGLRYDHAITVAPLTLPAHATLLTGRLPAEHGVVDNGVAVLAAGVPTLAELLAAAGYETVAVVGSRILDRRFGLDRGFARYDDGMAAERVGEYGYPERSARQVVDSALGLVADVREPFFLWVHFYDAHAPYEPAPEWTRRGTARDLYAGEVVEVDRQLGRLLDGLAPESLLVALVADHGEMLGEHGERTHGLFLYGGSLEVPLVLAGPGVPVGRTVGETVATRRLGATLLRILGVGGGPELPGPVLPGIGGDALPAPVVSETRFPATAYGWSPLRAVTDDRWRYVEAPRPELYDLRADPGETKNVVAAKGQVAERLAAELGPRSTGEGSAAPDAEALALVRSLGYLSGSTGGVRSGLDPKDGVALLARFDEAKERLATGDARGAVGVLRQLDRESPGSVPFLVRLAAAELAAGDPAAGIATYGRALALNPGLDFLHLNLGAALSQLGRTEEAQASFRRALAINPRFAPAWIHLVELAGAEGEAPVLEEAVAAGADSVVLLVRLAQREEAAGRWPEADRRFAAALELMPEWPPLWSMWAKMHAARGDLAGALERARRAVGLAPVDAGLRLELALLLEQAGQREAARVELEAAARSDGPAAEEARRRLALETEAGGG